MSPFSGWIQTTFGGNFSHPKKQLGRVNENPGVLLYLAQEFQKDDYKHRLKFGSGLVNICFRRCPGSSVFQPSVRTISVLFSLLWLEIDGFTVLDELMAIFQGRLFCQKDTYGLNWFRQVGLFVVGNS